MTCTSCAARIEKKLNRMEGVSATVNYATEKATVQVSDSVEPAALIATIEQAGYGATLPAETVDEHERELDVLRRRLLITTPMSVPVIAMSMVPVLQFPGWQWLSLLLSVAIVGWGGWPFHRATLINLRHAQATTLTAKLSHSRVVFRSTWPWILSRTLRSSSAKPVYAFGSSTTIACRRVRRAGTCRGRGRLRRRPLRRAPRPHPRTHARRHSRSRSTRSAAVGARDRAGAAATSQATSAAVTARGRDRARGATRRGAARFRCEPRRTGRCTRAPDPLRRDRTAPPAGGQLVTRLSRGGAAQHRHEPAGENARSTSS